MKRLLLFFHTMLFLVSVTWAQSTVTGVVTDPDDGSALPGVSIIIKGTTNGTLTGINGEYTLSASNEDVLQFSYVGYETTEMPVGNQSVIDMKMTTDIAQLEEIVIVGYGEQKKVTVTGAIAAIKGEELTKSPSINLASSLAGRLPGLLVIQSSGEPGDETVSLRVRGQNTIGDTSPLVVIDGIPDRDGGLTRVSPSDIESVSILKDAAAAIYGARAANGVILITTKRGEKGKPKITFDFNQGWQQPTSTPDLANSLEYANIRNEHEIYSLDQSEWATALQGIQTNGTYTPIDPDQPVLNAQFSPEAVQGFRDGSDPLRYPDTDWFGATFRDWTPQSRYNVTVSGGTDNVDYLTSIGYLHQDGIYKNSATQYDQYSLRLNVGAKINEFVKTRVGILVRREDRQTTTEPTNAIFRMLMRGRPGEPAVWPNGLPGPDIENGQQPVVVTTNATGSNTIPQDFLQTNGSIEITQPWIEGLKLTLSGTVDHRSVNTKLFETPWTLYSWDGTSFEGDGVSPQLTGAIRSPFQNARLTQTHSSRLNINMTSMINYDRKIGADHNIGVLLGVTRETFTGEGIFAQRRNFLSPAIDQLFAGGAENQQTNGSAFDRARLGYFGRLQYNFKEKYLAEFLLRRDGSYIFPKSDRFGYFPGILVGWNVSEENWFNFRPIDYLKVRASFGQMGNDRISFDANGDGVLDPGELQEFAFLSTFGFGQVPINGQVVTTLQESTLANESFTWERASNFNLGIDGTIANGLLDFTVEYFKNRRNRILIQETGSTPESSGIASKLPPINAGKVDNSGFEFNLFHNGSAGELTYRIGFNGGYAKNKIIFIDEVPGIPDYQKAEGKPIGAHFVYLADGAFQDQAAIEAETLDYTAVTGNLRPGDLRFKDVNEDGIINGDDQVRTDKSIVPRFQYGTTFDLKWRNFDFSMLFQGASGAQARIFTESGDIGNYLKYHSDNRWSIENPSDRFPRLASRGDTYWTGGSFNNNTYHLFNTSYLRLKNIEIGYTIPNNKGYFKEFRIYINALNLFTIDDGDIPFDPETTQGAGQFYPLSRVINTGFSFTF